MRLLDHEVDDAAGVPHQRRREVDEETLDAAGLEIRHVDDGQRELSGTDQLADHLTGGGMQRDMPAGTAQDLERQPLARLR
jgi:hypothetical protein